MTKLASDLRTETGYRIRGVPRGESKGTPLKRRRRGDTKGAVDVAEGNVAALVPGEDERIWAAIIGTSFVPD